jgi:hypothetical protein
MEASKSERQAARRFLDGGLCATLSASQTSSV